MNEMKVTIIIPTLDGDRDGLTEKTIQSCKNQEGFILGVDYEIIIQQADETLGKNINDGVTKSKGKYIKICADDDLLTPNCLKVLYEKAEEGFDFICANSINFNINGDEDLYFSCIPETVSELAQENTFHGGTILYLKETMLPFDEEMWTAEEYEHALRTAAAGLRFGYVNEIVYRYRLHDDQKSGAQWEGGRVNRLKRIPRYEYIYGERGIISKYIHNTNPINNGH
jgi:glycosyltransferase involved in cell wall biosynthesis